MIIRSRLPRAAPGTPGSRLIIGLLAGLACLLPSPVAGQFAVYPVQVQLEAEDRVATRAITVDNRSPEQLDVTVYLNDYDRAAAGEHSYLPLGEHGHSCAGRLEAFPDQLSLAPDETGEIRIRLEPGAGTCWGVVFVEKRTPTPSGVMVAQRIGVKVLAQADGLAREGQVLAVQADTTSEPAAFIAFQNDGRGVLEVSGEIEVRTPAGEIVAVTDVESFKVLPGHRRRIRAPMDVTLEPGRYLLVAILDFGADYLAGGQAMMEVKPE